MSADLENPLDNIHDIIKGNFNFTRDLLCILLLNQDVFIFRAWTCHRPNWGIWNQPVLGKSHLNMIICWIRIMPLIGKPKQKHRKTVAVFFIISLKINCFVLLDMFLGFTLFPFSSVNVLFCGSFLFSLLDHYHLGPGTWNIQGIGNKIGDFAQKLERPLFWYLKRRNQTRHTKPRQMYVSLHWN